MCRDHFHGACSGGRDRRLHDGAARIVEWSENVFNTIAYDFRLSDTNLDPSERIGLKGLQD